MQHCFTITSAFRPQRQRAKRVSIVVAMLSAIGLSASVTASETDSRDAVPTQTSHAIAMHGEPKYPADFSHFDFVNPEAPKGGRLRRHVIGSFDSLNPFVPRGTAATQVSLVYDTLTISSDDEPFTQYGLLAKSMTWPDDRRWIRITLRPEARFADGTPVTAKDVKWTFNTLIEEGQPFYSFYYGGVERIEIHDDHNLTFHFQDSNNPELALIIGQLPVLPSHFWKDKPFTRSGLTVPLGSGPYEITHVDTGKRVTYSRRDDYWARDLPVNRGRYNFDTLQFDYYLDDTVALQAFRRGDYDWRHEFSASNWANQYQGGPFESGRLVTHEFEHSNPAGMQGFVFNLRRELFADPVLREAMGYAFDFEWSNANLFHGQYRRTRSYFENSELAATGLPSEEELALLAPFKDELPARVFSHAFTPPTTDGSGRPRQNLRQAQNLLADAGYTVSNGQLHTPDGQPVRFEILLHSPAFERIVQPFTRNLRTLGIEARMVRVDTSQYVERVRQFNFDMVVNTFGQSTSPGNEQWDYWGSAAADRPGSRNLVGIENPVVDAMIEHIVTADSREQLITASRALDRVLQWHFYVIPNWHVDRHRIAFDSRFRFPELGPYLGSDAAINTWWDSRAE